MVSIGFHQSLAEFTALASEKNSRIPRRPKRCCGRREGSGFPAVPPILGWSLKVEFYETKPLGLFFQVMWLMFHYKPAFVDDLDYRFPSGKQIQVNEQKI